MAGIGESGVLDGTVRLVRSFHEVMRHMQVSLGGKML